LRRLFAGAKGVSLFCFPAKRRAGSAAKSGDYAFRRRFPTAPSVAVAAAGAVEAARAGARSRFWKIGYHRAVTGKSGRGRGKKRGPFMYISIARAAVLIKEHIE